METAPFLDGRRFPGNTPAVVWQYSVGACIACPGIACQLTERLSITGERHVHIGIPGTVKFDCHGNLGGIPILSARIGFPPWEKYRETATGRIGGIQGSRCLLWHGMVPPMPVRDRRRIR